VRRNRLTRVLAAITALLCTLALIACQPPGRQKKVQIYETDEFKSAIQIFEWPDEPSHEIALEIADHGTVRIGLYDQVTPITVAHIVDLVTRGVYDDTLFHRVIKDFMIQGGDPTTRKRGPDTTRGHWKNLSVEDEFKPIHLDRGVIALGNRGRAGSAASQFFIVLSDQREMDGRYTVFGRVLSGMEVVDAIAEVETDEFGRWGSKDKPLKNVILARATVEGTKDAEIAGGVAAPGSTPQPETAPQNESLGIAQRG
jgi:cyclophilin family peptidyl-prolyl cis-trans isomerase